MLKRHFIFGSPLVVLIVFVLFGSGRVWAHCDGLDGPVVKAAQKALEDGNVNPVLIWVQRKNEAEIQKAFQKTLAVRQLGPEAKELADRYFFETLVRLHRAGEDAPYTGLKPAGRDLGPAIPAADKALESSSLEPLSRLLKETLEEGLQRHFRSVIGKTDFGVDEVTKGREYVEAYVRFVHYVEHLFEAAARVAEGHYPESKEAGSHN